MEQSFVDWVEDAKTEFRRLGFIEKSIASIDWEAYRVYYDYGYSPEDAIKEDLSNLD